MKTNIIFILFGLLLGVGAAEILWRFYDRPKEGQEFESVADFRATLLNPTTETRAKGKGDGSLSFAGIVNAHPDDKIIYDLRPNLDVRFTGVNVKTNSCGMRGAERPIKKPPGTYRIALLGDSFSFGWGVEQQDSFAQVLEDNLNRLTARHPQVEVLNFGVPGYSTFQEVAAFKEKGVDFNPDTVVVFFVHNDFDFPFFVRDLSKPDGLVQSFSLARLGNRALHPNLAQAKMQMKGLDPNASLAELAHFSNSHGIKLQFVINPRKEWREYLQRLPVISEQQSITYMNIGPDFERMVEEHHYTEDQLNLPKDLHPSVLRHHMYADLMTPYVWSDIAQIDKTF